MISLRTLGSTTVQYTLFIFNLILAISGLVLFVLGIVIKGVYNEYEPLLDDRYFSASSLLIASGSLLFIFSFFGCCGAIKENRAMLYIYAFLLSIVFVLELACGITGYVLSSQTEEVITTNLKDTMSKYNSSSYASITRLWDMVQNKFECCGVANATDWQQAGFKDKLPVSCCHSSVTVCLANDTSSVNKHGCETAVVELITKNDVAIGSGALSVILVQLVGIFCAMCLAKSVATSSYESV